MKITNNKIAIVLIGWLIFPTAVFIRSIFWPAVWVFQYGWRNTIFWHNVRAGWIQVCQEHADFWNGK